MIPSLISFDLQNNVRFILFSTFFCVRGIVLDMNAMIVVVVKVCQSAVSVSVCGSLSLFLCFMSDVCCAVCSRSLFLSVSASCACSAGFESIFHLFI